MDFDTSEEEHTAPVVEVIRHLMTTDGTRLELLARTNTALAHACAMQTIFSRIKDTDGTVGVGYVNDRVEQTKRLSVSMGGKGREELLLAIEKGGQLPAEYYQDNNSLRGAEFTVIGDDEP